MKYKILVTGGSGFIGTNLIQLLHEKNIEILNIDIKKPLLNDHLSYWQDCDILNFQDLKEVISNYSPLQVIHLAAKTDTISQILEDYDVNIQGTRNLIEVCNKVDSVEKIVITSTQYVYRDLLNPYPQSDTCFKPHTIYGNSKVMTEKITREFCKKNFIIIRPTNIWGPYNYNYANGLFSMIKKGLFVLPRGSKTIKSYGYIKNICYQIISILDDIDSVNCVYYVGEESIVANMWASEISKAITGKPPIKIPKFLLFMVALLGELLKKMNLNFPFYLTRYKNMTEDYDVPIKKTITKFDLMYKDLNENINETIKWYKNEYEN